MRTNAKIRELWEERVRYAYRTGVAVDLATQHLFNIFTISGGDIVLLDIIGKVMFVKAGTAQTLELGFTPTGGARTILAIASATTTGDVANKYYTWDGVLGTAVLVAQTADAIGVGAVGSVLAGTSSARNVLCAGVLDITSAGANDITGLVDWYVRYIPVKPSSTVTPA
jgi:hypothetical protein